MTTITEPRAITQFFSAGTGTPLAEVEIIRDEETLDCPDFCDGSCTDWNDRPGNLHHTSGFDTLTVGDRDIDISTSRSDEDGKAGEHVVNMLSLHRAVELTMSPGTARQLAAMLLNAADAGNPLPDGVLAVEAKQVRIGDDIFTPSGWQKVVGQMAFFAGGDSDAQVNVWTDDYDHDPDTNGWEFQPGDIVQVRRRIHGSCAIAFVEPIR